MANSKTKEKHGRGRGWWLLPVGIVLPFAAGLTYVLIRYGHLLYTLVQAGCKVVVVR